MNNNVFPTLFSPTRSRRIRFCILVLSALFAWILQGCESGGNEDNVREEIAARSLPWIRAENFRLLDSLGRDVSIRGINARIEGVFDVEFDDSRTALEPIPAFTQDAWSKEIGEDGAPLWAIVPPPEKLLLPLRAADSRHSLWIEPDVVRNFSNGAPLLDKRFPDDNIVYCPHIYPAGVNATTYEEWKAWLVANYGNMRREANSWGAALVVGEWGIHPDSPEAEGYIRAQQAANSVDRCSFFPSHGWEHHPRYG